MTTMEDALDSPTDSQGSQHSPLRRRSNPHPSSLYIDAESHQEVTCQHDFSVLSLIEMQRLAAASVAAAFRRSSQDSRFTEYSDILLACAEEYDSRARGNGV
jgi:hypothetical protein